MPLMTRQQIKTEVAAMFGEVIGTLGAQNQFLLDRIVSRSADEVARGTDCFATISQQEIVQNQPDYTPPANIYRHSNAFVTDPSGTKQELVPMTSEQMDRTIPNWRNGTPGTPQFIITRGVNVMSLYPTPITSSLVYAYTDLVIQTNTYQVASVARPFVSGDVGSTLNFNTAADSGFNNGPNVIVSVASGIATLADPVGVATSASGIANLSLGGLYIEGWGTPGDTWPNPTDVCPLPERTHDLVVWRACVLRCRQFPKDYADFLPGMTAEWDRAKGLLEAETVRLTRATKSGTRISRPGSGGYDGYGCYYGG